MHNENPSDNRTTPNQPQLPLAAKCSAPSPPPALFSDSMPLHQLRPPRRKPPSRRANPAASPDALVSMARLRNYKSRRSSSWDRTGGNDDSPVDPGATVTLLDVNGAGVITHIWFTINSSDPHAPQEPGASRVVGWRILAVHRGADWRFLRAHAGRVFHLSVGSARRWRR